MTAMVFSTQTLAQYDLRASVADFPAEMTAYRQASAQAHEALADCVSTHRYGQAEHEQLDVFAADRPGAPVYLFIHGGYWRMLGRADSAMMARSLHAAGACVVTVDYGLAPAFTLAQMVAQCERALAWVVQHAAEFGADPRRIHVSGSSAGAQLAGMLLARDAARAPGARQLRSASLLSGLMDLHPLLQTPVNDWLRLDAAAAQSFSPSWHPPAPGTPVLVAWGEQEPAVMHAQSEHYAEQCRRAGCVVQTLAVAQRNHFDVLLDLNDPASELTRRIVAMLHASR